MIRPIILILILWGTVRCSNSTFTAYNPAKDCEVESSDNGVLLSCADGSTYLIKNGSDGQNGEDGQDGTDGIDGISVVTEVIPLCPTLSGDHKEVVLRIGDDLVTYFTTNNNATEARLTLLQEGVNYSTTDTNNGLCNFTVLNGDIVYE